MGIPPDEARLEARLLAAHALNLTREALYVRGSEPVDPAILEPFLCRREAREPLSYLLGERGFYGRDFFVTPDVLIPRPETELLVEVCLGFWGSGEVGSSEWVSGSLAPFPHSPFPIPHSPILADIGTGSGCIAITLACELPQARVFATDLSESALSVARRNAERHGAAIEFLPGDLLGPLPDGLLFDAIVSNPPYISQGEQATLSPEVLGEPHVALFDVEADGLGFYRRLASKSPEKLAPGGLLAVEVGQGQAESVAWLWSAAGLSDVTILLDIAGIGRVVRGIWSCK